MTADTAMANYTVISRSEQNGKTTIRRDRSTNVFECRDGRWQIVADHTFAVAPTVSGMHVGWIRTPYYSSNGYSMRVDSNIKHGDKSSALIKFTCGFDNMPARSVKGTTDWKQYEVVLDVPTEAVSVIIGTFLSGKGQMWAGDLKLKIVGSDVPSTNQLLPEQMRIDDPNRNPKKSDIKQPVNLGFENGTMADVAGQFDCRILQLCA